MVDEILKKIKKTLFLAKQIDDFDNFMSPTEDYSIVACRVSEKYFKKYSDLYVLEIIDGFRSGSTEKSLLKLLQNHYTNLKGIENIWTYRPYLWTNDFNSIGIKSYSIDYFLYLRLQNKLDQKRLLLETLMFDNDLDNYSKNQLMKSFTMNNTLIFPKSKYSYYDLKKIYRSNFVLYSANSDGGSGVFKITTINEYINAFNIIKTPIIRTEEFIENAIPVNQIGFILPKGQIIKYEPSIQIIRNFTQYNKFEYQGSDFNTNQFLSLKQKRDISRLTYSIGKILIQLGYKGMFGCDFLVQEQNIKFIEINPRYQASSVIPLNSKELDFIFHPHFLHILGFEDTNEELYNTYSKKAKPEAFIQINKSFYTGYLKIFNDRMRIDYKPLANIIIDKNLEEGYSLFSKGIISSPYYPTELAIRD